MAQREKEALKAANLIMEEKLKQTESIANEGNESNDHLEARLPTPLPPSCSPQCKESPEIPLAGTQHKHQDGLEPMEAADETEVAHIPTASMVAKVREDESAFNVKNPDAEGEFFAELLIEADETESKAKAVRKERQSTSVIQRRRLDKQTAILEREVEVLRTVVERWKNLTLENKSSSSPAFDS
ncbi:hypothetical protein CPB86DRAFT_857934 [Serendipita vermifera]|nr:hypothetical protein CPB86DRAFT_857934 [Serendipita vermifera]